MKNKIKTITGLIMIAALALNANAFGQKQSANSNLCDHACSVSAGPDKTDCNDNPVTIGGSPTASPGDCQVPGGSTGITYSWTPSTGLSCTNCPNPVCSAIGNHTYTVTVTFDGYCCCDQPYQTKTCHGNPPCDAVPHSDVVVVHINCNCCKIDNISNQSEKEDGGTKVYPNPSTGTFNLNLGEVKPNMVISVYDMEGNNILLKENVTENTNILDLTGKAKGIYFVRVTTNDEVSFFKKIILQ